MNTSVYLFGVFENGYSQYPDDSLSKLFKKFYANSKTDTQIVIHRDENLMFYSYIRKLGGDKYIGLCTVLNGLMITQTGKLFSIFENVIGGMITRGDMIGFDDQGNIVPRARVLYMNRDSIETIQNFIGRSFNNIPTSSLPSKDYSISATSSKEFTIDDSNDDIVRASSKYPYTYIYKSKDYNTINVNSSARIIKRLSNEKNELKKQCSDLNSTITKLKIAQRNFKLVSILAIVVLIFGFIIWNQVLFPSVVTNYDAGEYMYYGPMEDGKPNGVGVAIYHEDDSQERKYYIGNFVNGNRQDKEAMLYYKGGDYYYGAMTGDKWEEGLYYSTTDKSHFEGTFKDNKPLKGTWYEHKKHHDIPIDSVYNSKL